MEDIYSAKTAAVNFTFELCKSKGKLVMSDYIQHLGMIMTQHNTAMQNGQVSDEVASQMNGALLGLGAIADILKRKVIPTMDIVSRNPLSRLVRICCYYICPGVGRL